MGDGLYKISLVLYPYKWNPGGTFQGGRGLKQGNPLSPLLFVLSREYFTRLMLKASLQPGFSYHPHYKALQLSHLMFADDIMPFSKAYLPTLRIIMATLQEFYDCAGLQANHTKSQIVFGGCTPHLEQQHP